MKTRMMRKIAVLVTGSALALSFPVAGAIADSGGVPHDGSHGKGKQHKNNGQNRQCPTWSNGKGVQHDLPNQASQNGQGLKCGFHFSNGGLTPAS
jgi:hypothetical protein